MGRDVPRKVWRVWFRKVNRSRRGERTLKGCRFVHGYWTFSLNNKIKKSVPEVSFLQNNILDWHRKLNGMWIKCPSRRKRQPFDQRVCIQQVHPMEPGILHAVYILHAWHIILHIWHNAWHIILHIWHITLHAWHIILHAWYIILYTWLIILDYGISSYMHGTPSMQVCK